MSDMPSALARRVRAAAAVPFGGSTVGRARNLWAFYISRVRHLDGTVSCSFGVPLSRTRESHQRWVHQCSELQVPLALLIFFCMECHRVIHERSNVQ